MSSVYIGFGEYKGVRVCEEDAYDFAKEHLDEVSSEDKQGFVDWFFSGNFMKKEDSDEQF